MKIDNLVMLALDLVEEACKTARNNEGKIMHGLEVERLHGQVVLEWVEKLSSIASDELKVAAVLHDIDRLVNPAFAGGFKGDRNSPEYQAHKKAHAQRSAAYVTSKLTEHGVPEKIIERVVFLITHHDDAGDEVAQFNDYELNTLVAADSFAFFTSFAQKILDDEGEDRLKDKIRFMVKKMPVSSREFLSKYQLKDPRFEAIKNNILKSL